MSTDIKEVARLLRERLAHLEQADISGLTEQATVQLDQQSVGRLNRMDALQRQQMAKETARRRQLDRAKIRAALSRIEDNEYGWCASCGEGISPGRLAADPTAHLCVDCAN